LVWLNLCFVTITGFTLVDKMSQKRLLLGLPASTTSVYNPLRSAFEKSVIFWIYRWHHSLHLLINKEISPWNLLLKLRILLICWVCCYFTWLVYLFSYFINLHYYITTLFLVNLTKSYCLQQLVHFDNKDKAICLLYSWGAIHVRTI
jgi:hypothetical protein